MIFEQRQHLLLPWMAFTAFLLLLVGTSSVLGENAEVGDEGESSNSTVKRNVTGNPQIDYLSDPNLPHELNGYNLSSYPFHTRVPSNIDFECGDLKGGFYANIEHKCQIYHHCLFGTRYDFLCANYTAFDQRTFICQFVSEVDCENSHLFFHRNDALYIATTTTTVAPSVNVPIGGGRRIRPAVLPSRDENVGSEVETDYPAEPERPRDRDRPRDKNPPRRRSRRRCGPGRRRKCRRPPPRTDYDEYDDYDDYYEADRRPIRNRDRARDRDSEYDDYETEEALPAKKRKTKNTKYSEDSVLSSSTAASAPAPPKSKAIDQRSPNPIPLADDQPLDPATIAVNREKLFTKSRAPPRIKPPVPVHEKRKYHGIQGRPSEAPSTTTTPKTTTTASVVQGPASTEYDDEYYYDDYETTTSAPRRDNRYLPTSPPATTTTTTTTTSTTSPPPPASGPEYEYEYEDYETETQAPRIKPTSTTTVKPARGLGPRRSQSQSRLSVSSVIPDALQEARNSPGEEHLKINEALETPSRPSFRQPYHNRPRPDFIRNAQMLQPITTLRTTTTSTTSTTSERPGFMTGSSFDGMNRRFPAFDDTRAESPLTSADRLRNSRFRQRPPTPTRGTTTSTTEAPTEDYTEYNESQEMPERYGQKSIGSSYSLTPQDTEDYSRHSQQYMLAPVQQQPQRQQYQPPPPPPETPPTQPSYQIYRQRERTPPLQTNFVTPTSSTRPEFISLLSDDDDSTSYYPTNPQPQAPSRFRHQARPLLTSAQEIYPQYQRPASGFPGPYVSSIRPRNSFPMYSSPFGYGNY